MAPASLITGAASGIGAAVAEALAQRGHDLTLLDLDQRGLQRSASRLSSSHPSLKVHCQALNVTDSAAQEAAFAAHIARFGRLDVAVLNAGIGERGDILDPAVPQDPSRGGWQATLDVDLTAVLTGIRSAATHMAASGGGTIISVASAGALFPMPSAPVYAASKAGVLHFTRSLAGQLSKRGVRAMVLCPEFVDTPLVRDVMRDAPDKAVKLLGSLDIKLLSPAYVAGVAMQLLEPSVKSGTCLLIRQDGQVQQPLARKPKGLGDSPARGSSQQLQLTPGPQHLHLLAAWATDAWPATYRKVQVHRLSTNFRDATRIIEFPLPLRSPPSGAVGLPPGSLLLRRVAVGINASDINYTSGRYYGSAKAAEAKLPFDAGFESVSVVAAVGPQVQGFVVGQPVATMTYDGFGEWAATPAKLCLKVPRPAPEMVALLTSGLTASIALAVAGQLKAGETVLVTAAAGGTGQFAVQLAKLAGCHVVATCGGPEKAAMLRSLGADRVVDYKTEKLKDVLRKEYPKGVDVVYEGVGGDMFEAALANLADRGRLLVIGMMTSYAEGWPLSSYPGMAERLLWKSAAVIGFFLLRYAQHFRAHLSQLIQLMDAGKLKVALDPKRFVGIESVPDAVDWLYSGKSVGKVVVQLAREMPPSAPSRL